MKLFNFNKEKTTSIAVVEKKKYSDDILKIHHEILLKNHLKRQ